MSEITAEQRRRAMSDLVMLINNPRTREQALQTKRGGSGSSELLDWLWDLLFGVFSAHMAEFAAEVERREKR